MNLNLKCFLGRLDTGVWKYVAILVMNVIAVGPTPLPSTDTSNPIQTAYSWANLLSTLTDRALWIFFLFVILTIAWWIDKRKEKELTHYRQHIASTLVTVDKTLGDVDKVLGRIERKLDDN